MAVERLGVKAEEAVYIGDTATDIEAARAAGMKIILYAQTSLKGADFRVSSFREIPRAVGKLNREE
jgi:FMN phosphatase YigB (HAD superfamily)